MSSVSLLVLLALLLLCLDGVCGVDMIVSDDYGNEIGLPYSGGVATGGYTIDNAMFALSPYNVTVYINNQYISYQGAYRQQSQSFYVSPSLNGATLLKSYYQAGILDTTSNTVIYNGPIISGNYVGSPTQPNTAIGAYIYEFEIPQYNNLNMQIVYSNQGNPTITDFITISVSNNFAS